MYPCINTTIYIISNANEQLYLLSSISMDATEDDPAVVYILGVILNNVTSFNCDNEKIQV